MTEVEADQLKEAVEHLHGGSATLAQSVPVRETFEGKTVWEGVVHVFDLADPRLRLVLADRGEYQTPVRRSAAHRANQLAPRGGAGGHRSGASRETMSVRISKQMPPVGTGLLVRLPIRSGFHGIRQLCSRTEGKQSGSRCVYHAWEALYSSRKTRRRRRRRTRL
jgi:hypothetical protein